MDFAGFTFLLLVKDGLLVIPISSRQERTLAKPVEVEGIGFITGSFVTLRFCPAAENTGIVFHRTDLSPKTFIPAHVSNVTGTNRRTTLGQKPFQVTLVEHVLAALSGLRIDNCIVELNAGEPPGLDGSAGEFVDALKKAGSVPQNSKKMIYGVESPIIVESNGSTLALHPCEGTGLKMTYFLDYGNQSPIQKQVHTQNIEPALFSREISRCRTFILEEEAEMLKSQGIGSRTTAQDLIIFGPKGPIDNPLRFANEPARHKLLDMLGDLALLGVDLCGHVVAYRSGHPLNVELARTLSQKLKMNMQPTMLRAA